MPYSTQLSKLSPDLPAPFTPIAARPQTDMTSSSVYLVAADVVLATHLMFVAFVVLGLLLIFTGGILRWAWVRNRSFRTLHGLSIGLVVVQAWFGMVCPLTTLENWLRGKAGSTVYAGTFVSHWMNQLLYYDAPAWVFAVAYTVFGGLVIASWYFVRPLTR
jgi:hypothetical protein